MPSTAEALTELHWSNNILELWSAISRGRISDVTAACRVPVDTSFSLCGTRFYDYCWSEAFATLIFFSSCENKLLVSSRGFVLDRWSLAQNKEILVVTLNAVSSDVNDFSFLLSHHINILSLSGKNCHLQFKNSYNVREFSRANGCLPEIEI